MLVANSTQAQTVPVVEAGTGRSSALVQVQDGGQVTVLLNQIDTLQQEVMDLRGLVEQQAYTMEQIQREGRDRYLDLDRRVSQLVRQVQSDVKTSVVADPAKSLGTAARASSGDADYQQAFQAVRDKRFGDAISGLTTYLQTYPKGVYADNAQYWLGEIYLLQESFDEAEAAFSRLVSQFPKSDKRPDALYKLGQLNDRLGNDSQAKGYLLRVIKEYPNTASARLADVYLGNIEG